MKKILLFLALLLALPVCAHADAELTVDAPSAILMEKQTGEVIFEKNAYEHLSPASVTKVMTMLLVVEAVERGDIALDDTVTASERAASMGGSQIWLEAGESMTVAEMLKCVTVVSANDCCVALAEHLCGSEEAFVARMNERAEELGMADTHFACCSGLLESDEHYSCARDIAVMSRELISHDMIKEYTTIWMDTIRGGEFTLSNTNKLIYHYSGATGLKTGYTSKAGFCLAATAERDGVEYIAVVLNDETSAKRFADASAMLNYAFANYTLCSVSGAEAIPPVAVTLGSTDSVQPVAAGDGLVVVRRSEAAGLEYSLTLPESVEAPVAAGQTLGTLSLTLNGETLRSVELVAASEVQKLTLWDVWLGIFRALVGNG